MMPGVNQDFCLRAGGAREKQRHAPIGDVGMVESGLERLVLEQKALPRGQGDMRLLQPGAEPLLALSNICRARVVGAVAKPQGIVPAVQTPSNLDAVFD